MWNLLLDIVPNEDGNFYFDNWGEPFLYALIGFAIVFAGILLLILIVWLIGLLMRKTDNLAFLTSKRRRKAKEEAAEGVSVSADAASGKQEATEEMTDGDGIPDNVRAAIIAAVLACCVDEEKPECEFVVRRIRRI